MPALRPWRDRGFLSRGVSLSMVPSRREVVMTDASASGLAGSVEGQSSERMLVGAGGNTAHKCARTQGSAFGTYRIPAISEEQTCSCALRQHDCSLPHQPPRGHEVNPAAAGGHLLVWAFPRLASLRAMYLPGSQNQVADLLSCQKPPSGEWRLYPEVVEQIRLMYGKAELDLFASKPSTHCPLWFSLMEMTRPQGQDPLTHPWPGRLPYASLPFPLITATLHRLQQTNHRLLLVAPNWLGGPWLLHLRSLLRGAPWCLPTRQDLLSQLEGSIWHQTVCSCRYGH